VTEGIFGFRPTGLNAFTIMPQLPAAWNEMALNSIVAFGGKKIDITVKRSGEKIKVTITSDGRIVKNVQVANGSIVEIKL
jgi:uncharacterized surface protein with fasciclin (FAS1) repeats